jgi:hypothetical protein
MGDQQMIDWQCLPSQNVYWLRGSIPVDALVGFATTIMRPGRVVPSPVITSSRTLNRW